MNPDDSIEPAPSANDGDAASVAPPQPEVPPSARSKSKPKKAPELPSLERRNWLIHAHFVRREFDVCKAVIRSQLDETRGMCEYANYIHGLILRHEGKVQESLEMFQICNILNPNSADHIKQMARSLFLLGRHRLAIEAYKQAEARAEKPDWEIFHNLGVCYMYLGQLDEARSELMRALGAHKNEQTFVTLGKIFLMQSNVSGATEVYKAAVAHSPESPELCTTLGLLHLQSGQFDRAFEQLGTAMAFQPNYARAVMAAGSMMQSHSDLDVALSKYRTAAGADMAESPQLWNNIGMCFFGKKKYVAAVSCLKRASYLAPFDWKILYNLGLVHLTLQQFASAFHFLSASINLRPNRGQTFMLLAIALAHLKDADNAKTAYEQALQLDSKDPAIALNLAILHFNQKNNDAAHTQMGVFEKRVNEIRKTPGLDADPDVISTAVSLASKLDYVLTVVPMPKSSSASSASLPAPTYEKAKPRQPSASVRDARASLKAQMKAEGLDKRMGENEEVQIATAKAH